MSADFLWLGDNFVLESSIPVVDPNEGLFWRQVFVGPLNSLVSQRDLMNIQPDERISISQRNGPIFQMEIITPDYRDGQSSSLNKYDLITHEVEKSIADHPLGLAVGADEIDNLKEFLRGKVALADLDFASNDSAIIYSKLLLGSGSAKFLGFERTFKYSIVTSVRFGTLASEFGVGKLWTAAQIINPATSGIFFPPSMKFSLAVIDTNAPASVNKTIVTNVAATPTTITETYSWRWLKLGPHVENLPSGKIRISQEWMGDLWSTWEYAEAYP